MKPPVIFTTILPPEKGCTSEYTGFGFLPVVVGDGKTPEDLWRREPKIVFLGLKEQAELSPWLYQAMKPGHYARKNFGYIWAKKNGYNEFCEADDDTVPEKQWGQAPGYFLSTKGDVFNSFRHYFGDYVPRGWPESFDEAQVLTEPTVAADFSVLQWMICGDTDVSAKARLKGSIDARKRSQMGSGVRLALGCFSVFNTQNTLWRSDHDLAYLPRTVHMRVCDIMRSYVATHLLEVRGKHLAFGPPNTFHHRHPHNLDEDCAAERPLYEHAEAMIACIKHETTMLGSYRQLARRGFCGEEELELLRAFLDAMDAKDGN